VFAYTNTAAALIQSLVSSAGGKSASGLRLSLDPSWASLRMELVPGSGVADQVFSHRGTKVFVTEAAAARLGTQVLDARIEEQRAAFFLVDREDEARL
jgi:Fe-S cluster assembly iron-binding protein IscA